ncbi:hypothetical protein [Haloglycomyces albus]|uniref:hypothetical protein n=1 Tax=Haloglycomyces albus TaxID=526067 RepID=UPI00046CDF8A|nr:hypothetical protein [Haloglycomyces albus]
MSVAGASPRTKRLIGVVAAAWGVLLVVVMFLSDNDTVREQVSIDEAEQDGAELREAVEDSLLPYVAEVQRLDGMDTEIDGSVDSGNHVLYWYPAHRESCDITPVRSGEELVWEFVAYPEDAEQAFTDTGDALEDGFAAESEATDTYWGGRTDRYLRVRMNLHESSGEDMASVTGRVNTECRPE